MEYSKYWHLVGRYQGFCYSYFKAQDYPNKELYNIKMSIALRLRIPA